MGSITATKPALLSRSAARFNASIEAACWAAGGLHPQRACPESRMICLAPVVAPGE